MPRARRRRAAPPPLEGDDVKVVTIGTVLWAIAFVAIVPFYGRLADDGRGWWAWTCLAGFGLGLLGIEYCRRRRSALEENAALAAEDRRARPREPLT